MGKFVIECPKCGTYQEASTSFFAKKLLTCPCGNTINVKQDKYTIKECAHCGNTMMYDQSKGDKVKCHICNNPLVSEESLKNFEQINCPSCSCELTVSKMADSYVCPLCNTKIDVQKEIEKSKITKKGLASVIKYEGSNDVLIWKHPITDFNLGSQLIVYESQEAILFKDGKALDCFPAGRFTLTTQKLPLLNELYKLPVDANVFHSEVYFVNLVTHTNIKWGTDSKVRLFDPESGLHVELGACGEFNIRVVNGRKLLIKLIGTTDGLSNSDILSTSYDAKTMTGKFKGLVVSKVKTLLAKTIREQRISVLEIDEHTEELANLLKVEINKVIDDYGLFISEFYITNIMTPDDDPNFKRLKEQHAARYLKVEEQRIRKAEAEAAQEAELILATTEARKRAIQAEGHAAEITSIGLAEANVLKAKGGDYSLESARIVGKAAAENESGGGVGIASDIIKTGIGLGVGVQVAKGVMGTVNNVISSADDGWECNNCHHKGNKGNFCEACGSQKPVIESGWTCPNCKQSGLVSMFCPNCGTKKPEKSTWDCRCGTKDISSAFCPNCGCKKGE